MKSSICRKCQGGGGYSINIMGEVSGIMDYIKKGGRTNDDFIVQDIGSNKGQRVFKVSSFILIIRV
jgi:hypothetical protein